MDKIMEGCFYPPFEVFFHHERLNRESTEWCFYPPFEVFFHQVFQEGLYISVSATHHPIGV